MFSHISLFMVVFPNYKFYFLFHTWNIIISNIVGTIACMPPLAPCTTSRFFFSVSPIDTNFYAHPTMTIASMPGNYRSFRTLYASCMHVVVEFIHHGLIFVEIQLISMCITCKWACVKFIRWLEGQNINLSWLHKKIVYWMQVSMCII